MFVEGGNLDELSHKEIFPAGGRNVEPSKGFYSDSGFRGKHLPTPYLCNLANIPAQEARDEVAIPAIPAPRRHSHWPFSALFG